MNVIGPYFKELDVLAPSFLLAMLVGFIVSKLFPSQEVDETIAKALAENTKKRSIS